MREDLKTILDQCLEQIRHGEADVEACLARHPKHAEELRGLLEVALLLQHTIPPDPKSDAVSRGQQVLLDAVSQKRQEMAEARYARMSRPEGIFSRLRRTVSPDGTNKRQRAHRLYWRAALMLGIISVLFVASFGVALASGSSAPGDLLYPVKRATEKVRIAFSFSQSSKADLQIDFAERRVEEMAKVAKKGDAQDVAELTARVQAHLEQAQQSIQSIADSGGNVQGLKDHLVQTATTQLAILEISLAQAPDHVKPAMTQALGKSAAQFGAAVDSAASRVAATPPAQATGTIQFRAVDSTIPATETTVIQIGKIEAHLAGSDSQWITISDTPVSLDLQQISDIQKYLGSSQVPAGDYTQVRFTVASATTMSNGTRQAVSVPSEALKLVRPFQVKAGETTVVLINFDGSQSVQTADQGPQLQPVMQVSVPPTGNSAPGNSHAAVAVKETKVDIQGPVQDVGDSHLTIGGQRVEVDPQAQAKLAPQVGASAEVVASVQSDGSFKAKTIKMGDDPEVNVSAGNNSNGNVPTAAAAVPTPTATKGNTKTARATATFHRTPTPTATPTASSEPTSTRNAEPTATAARQYPTSEPQPPDDQTKTGDGGRPDAESAATATPGAVPSPTIVPTARATRAPTSTLAPTSPITATPTRTATRTATPSVTATQTATPTRAATRTATPTATATRTATTTATPRAMETPAATPTESAINAARIYAYNCATCHGSSRQGGSGPALTPTSLADTSNSTIKTIILQGASRMPAYSGKLTQEQVDALTWFLRTPTTASGGAETDSD